MDVSKNNGTPEWMVYNGKLIKMDDLGVPLFLETSIYHTRMLGDWSRRSVFEHENLRRTNHT